MYGICYNCAHQEQTREAYCPKCHYPWHIFPAKPKNPELWQERKGWFNRIRRSLPPWAVTQFLVSFLIATLLIPMNLLALVHEIYISHLSGPVMWITITCFDAVMAWLIYSSMRLSLKKYRLARFVISFNLGGTAIAFIHNWTQVIGHHIFLLAGLYLTLRLFCLLYICYVIWIDRIERAILRHGSPSS